MMNNRSKYNMKIAINCMFCQPKGGGIKEYIYNIVNALSRIDKENEYILYVLQDCLEFASGLLPKVPNMRIKATPYGESFMSVIKRSLFSNQYWLEEEKKEKFDLFHSPFFHSPKLKKAKVVITVHDLRFYRYPYTYTFLRYQFLRRAVRRSINNADHIISISSFTKSEIIDAYKIDSDKCTVVLEAINRNDFSSSQLVNYQLEDMAKHLHGKKFILSVGHIEPRKNYMRLIEAFKKIKQTNQCADDLHLVIVGKKGHHYEDVIKEIDATPNVHYLNFVSRNLLLWLYQNAAVFAFPSIYEGFGFPPLEAACFGTISSVSNISSIPEVCGDSVDYFDPLNIDDMAASLSRCLYDESVIEEKKSRLLPNLDRFSWDKNAEETLAIYKKIVNEK